LSGNRPVNLQLGIEPGLSKDGHPHEPTANQLWLAAGFFCANAAHFPNAKGSTMTDMLQEFWKSRTRGRVDDPLHGARLEAERGIMV
jgi:hypothetical protein